VLHRLNSAATQIQRTTTEAPRGHMYYIGLDVHKKTIILIGRLGQNAEAKTAQNNKEYVVLNIATQESWKNDKGDYETRTDGTASSPGGISRSSPRLSRRGSSSPLRGNQVSRGLGRGRGRYLQAQHRRGTRNKHEAALKNRSCGRSGRRCERGRRRSTNGTRDYLPNDEAEVA
jgi:hypothetical protein